MSINPSAKARVAAAALCVITLSAHGTVTAIEEGRSMETEFGKTPEGQAVTLFTLENAQGTILKMTDYGATVVSLEVADREGNRANITQGFDNLQGYFLSHPYFGATVGRYCNRIAKGKFTLDGKTYDLAINNEPNHLHGGDKGFNRYVWATEHVRQDDGLGVLFSRTSPDGEEGYPGNLKVAVLYFLGHDDSLKIEFTATTDQATPINLTNHCYWNLSGVGSGTILDHAMMIAADQYLPVDDTLIPTGKLANVAGTIYDFRTPKKIGQDIDKTPGNPNGYDHCFALRSQDGSLSLAAKVKDAKSGRVMEIHTTQPGIQFYTGNFLDGTEPNGGFARNYAFCLETQHYPDSPNQPGFPDAILRPGETFKQTTVHKFSVE